MKSKEFMEIYFQKQLTNKGYKCTFQDPETKEKIKNFYKTKYKCNTNAQIHITHFDNITEEYFRNNFIKNDRFLIHECAEYFNIHNVTAQFYKDKFNILEPNLNKKCQQENLWLDLLNITDRRHKIYINKKRFYPDGYDSTTNTVYEYLGDFYHGNPIIYDFDKINIRCNKTFKELYNNTFERFDKIKSLGYKIIYIWENDFIKNGKIKEDWKEKMREY